MERLTFPKGFLWGAATSAHQVEGGNHNDWSEWEPANAERLAREAKSKFGHLPNWPRIRARAEDPANYISGRACDHYHRFREDFDLAKKLGHNAHRFSIEWSRVEPEEGKFNQIEIKHYQQVVKALRERGIEPFVTLWHYTLPLWFFRKGGWMQHNAVEQFLRYAECIAETLGSEVNFWITENEPETVARNSYLTGRRPPGIRNPFTAYHALGQMFRAHQEARATIKAVNPAAQVGFAETIVWFHAYRNLPWNHILLRVLRWWRNNPFLADFIENSDFFGLEYYFHTRVRLHPHSQWWFQHNENRVVSDLGWELYPQGILRVLQRLKSFKKPMYIVEHGLADAADTRRLWYLHETMRHVARAIHEGIDIRGYFHWSLLDNFEWESGFWPRFGLVEVDYQTLERKIRPSAWGYKKIIDANGMEI